MVSGAVTGLSSDARDVFYMRKALRLADRGRGRTSPNPMVGAIVVDGDGVIVGRGVHERAGEPHAEVHALRDAGTRAEGGTLYCTLEPCIHHGRTAPCAPLVAEAGVRRVVIATGDPNPVAAGGEAFLRGRGLDVTSGVLAAEAREANRAFFSVVVRRRPWITMKIAVSLDGGIAARPGVRTSLTGPAANRLVHRDRAEVDAVAVGSGTVLTDDPMLTARVAFRERPLVRVVYDRRLRIPAASRLFSTLAAGPVIIITTTRHLAAAASKATALRSAGAEILAFEEGAGLRTSVEALTERGIGSLILEGGPELHAAFWDAGLVDRVQMYVAPCVLGKDGVGWIADEVMSSARVSGRTAWPVGNDVLLEGYVHGTD